MNVISPSPGTAKILLDSPSTQPALGFDRTASALAQIVTDSDPRFAVGIFGGWGSGKTTLMEAIQRTLSPDAVVAVPFNAWRFEREPQLLVPLVDTIRAALISWSKDRDAETREMVRDVARRIARVVRGLAMGLSGEVGVPGAVKIKYDVGRAVDELTAGNEPEQPQSLYVAAFDELRSAFEEFSSGGATRVVVFVDDLDRCLPSNALDVLESIKLFFDLPGFVFVVGLDEDVVQRAVRSRFSEGPFVSDTDAEGASTAVDVQSRLERDYVEKIFQVPYRLPPMVAEQLETLLDSIYRETVLPSQQLEDFQKRVLPHLGYVAVERRVNPREVKRYLNTYTLQTLVRPELDRDAVLTLQTLIFRYEWRPLYEAILTDSILFVEALKRYREGDELAFEDLSEDLKILPTGLGEFLRSAAAEALCRHDSLDPYLSSLESTGTTPRWLSEAYRDLGKLRAEIRRVRTIDTPTEQDGAQMTKVAKEVASRLSSLSSLVGERRTASLQDSLRQLESIIQELEVRTGGDSDVGEREDSLVTSAASKLYGVSNSVYRDLRSFREATSPSHVS